MKNGGKQCPDSTYTDRRTLIMHMQARMNCARHSFAAVALVGQNLNFVETKKTLIIFTDCEIRSPTVKYVEQITSTASPSDQAVFLLIILLDHSFICHPFHRQYQQHH